MAEPITVTIQGLNSPIATVKVQNKLSESAVTSVAGRVGDVLLTNADIAGLENVNNTSDLNKPISIATQAALDLKPDSGDFAATVHQHVLADITNAGTAAAADTGDFATSSHQHLLSDITNAGTAAASDTGDFATSAQGALADSALQNGDNISLLTNDAGYLTSFTNAVDSVNGQSGIVVLDADDIDDTSTTHKFATAAQLSGIDSALTSGDIDTLSKINSILTTPDLIDTNDPRLSDVRTPSLHASSHTDGTDDIQDATASQKGLATALQIQKLDSVESGANVTDTANVSGAGAQMTSEKNIAGGYAGLDGAGKVPSSQLPSYVDDVIEYPSLVNFPNPGEFGKIYVARDTNKIYRWSGTTYIEVGGGDVSPPVLSVNSLTGIVVLDADDLDDSSTTNKFTTQADIDKLSGISAGAEVNVNADWTSLGGDSEILNKPTLGTMSAADTGDYSLTGHTHDLSDLNQNGATNGEVIAWDSGSGAWVPSTSAAGSQADWDATSGPSEILNKPTLGTMSEADTGDYSKTGHNHTLSNILDAGSSASYDVASIGDAGLSEVVKGDDTRLTDYRNPLNHASSHVAGLDPIQSATTGQRGLATPAHIQALSGALQSGDNISLLNNDLLYVTSGYITGNYQPLDPVLTNTTASFTTGDETKLDYISVTQPVDLDAIESASGDMLASIYDPTNVSGNAFSMDNMVEGADTKIFTSGERDKLSGIAAGAEVNVQSDWDATSGDAFILNKPTLGTMASASTGDYSLTGHSHVAADIDSTGSTDGQVLTSDGSGNANWETLSANDVSGVAIIYEDASAAGYPATVGKFPTNYPIFDSISTSGDPRGLGSVDLQMRRTVSNQVASSQYSTILGGGLNRINASGVNAGLGSTVCGGSSNWIDNGQYAIILGGQNNKVGDYPTSAGSDSVVCGRYAHAKHNKTFVFSSEPSTVPFETLQTETFNIKAANGLRLITDGSQTAGQALVCDANGHGDWATINVGDVNGALQSGDNVSLLTNDANYTSSGDNVSLFVNDTGYLLSGDNISLLNNDLNYDQTTPTNVTGAMATAALPIDPTPELLDGVFVRYSDGGPNKIKLVTLQSIANQSPVISVNGLTGSAVLDPDDLDDELTNHKFASASQLANADSALQSGDNVSLLVNDANYTSSGDNVSLFANDAGYITDAVQSGDNVSLLVNDANYTSSGDNVSLFANDSLYVASGDNISQFNNDAGYITSAGAVSFNYRAETGNYNVTGTDYTIDCISGSQTITLPNASGIQGQIFVVKNSSTGVVTITGTASQTFDGYDSLETNFPQSLTLQSTNTNWIII